MNTHTAAERLDIWLNLEADKWGIEDQDRQAFIDAQRATTFAKLKALDYATDILAETGPLGTIMAFIFLGWRSRDAEARRHELDGVTRE